METVLNLYCIDKQKGSWKGSRVEGGTDEGHYSESEFSYLDHSGVSDKGWLPQATSIQIGLPPESRGLRGAQRQRKPSHFNRRKWISIVCRERQDAPGDQRQTQSRLTTQVIWSDCNIKSSMSVLQKRNWTSPKKSKCQLYQLGQETSVIWGQTRQIRKITDYS